MNSNICCLPWLFTWCTHGTYLVRLRSLCDFWPRRCGPLLQLQTSFYNLLKIVVRVNGRKNTSAFSAYTLNLWCWEKKKWDAFKTKPWNTGQSMRLQALDNYNCYEGEQMLFTWFDGDVMPNTQRGKLVFIPMLVCSSQGWKAEGSTPEGVLFLSRWGRRSLRRLHQLSRVPSCCADQEGWVSSCRF